MYDDSFVQTSDRVRMALERSGNSQNISSHANSNTPAATGMRARSPVTIHLVSPSVQALQRSRPPTQRVSRRGLESVRWDRNTDCHFAGLSSTFVGITDQVRSVLFIRRVGASRKRLYWPGLSSAYGTPKHPPIRPSIRAHSIVRFILGIVITTSFERMAAPPLLWGESVKREPSERC